MEEGAKCHGAPVRDYSKEDATLVEILYFEEGKMNLPHASESDMVTPPSMIIGWKILGIVYPKRQNKWE